MKKKSITIIGPTASGKSAMAIALAKKYAGEVISADSRQIYRGMDIGSGKEPGHLTSSSARGPHTKKAFVSAGIPHYMIDIAHPNTLYSAAKFVKKAQKIRTDICSREKLPIIAGGTMFWAQALAEDTVFTEIPPNPTLQKKLERCTSEDLFTLLKEKDERRATEIQVKNEINNKPRLIRALEIIDTIGHVPPQEKVHIDPNKHLIIAITPGKAVLHRKIEQRMDSWFRSGIFDEILVLHHAMRVPWVRLESFGLEYKWCTRFVRGQITAEDMRTNTIRDLKRYAKRQMTWIRRWERSALIHRVTTLTKSRKLVRNFLKK